jgi:lipopolysaccharide/colanic/teichoic acid biosynthesis glycosyltransferase
MYLFVKRLADIFCSTLALVFLLPIILIATIGIKLSSKGPIFYRASRVGKDGAKFTMHKFRTMHIDNNAKENSFIADKSRVFPFGAFLRKSKIDELPQLIDIVLGNMSIVGPRPASVSNVNDICVGEYRKILSVTPGLTSIASLFDYKHGELFVEDNEKYISEILPIKLELEMFYVKKRNIWMDSWLILDTIITIIQIICGKKYFKYTKFEMEVISSKNNKSTT